jgi:hypothetical protein
MNVNLVLQISVLNIGLKLNHMFTNLVNLIDSSKLKVELHYNFLGSDAKLTVLRVKNMITNNQVLGIDYKLEKKGAINYSIDIENIEPLDVDQLYAFDLSIRNGSMHQLCSLYLIRIGQDLSEHIGNLKLAYTHRASVYMGKQIADLSSVSSSDANSFVQSIYLLNRVSSNGADERVVQMLDLNGLFDLKDGKLYLDGNGAARGSWHEAVVVNAISGMTFLVEIEKILIDKISLRIFKIIHIQVGLKSKGKSPIDSFDFTSIHGFTN